MFEDLFDEYKEELPGKILDDVKKEIANHKVTKAQIKDILERTKKEYDEAKISPGEAIGVITAESFGEPGTQMCNSYYEKIIVKINDEIKIIEIGKFVDGLIGLRGFLKTNNSQILPLQDLEVYTLSVDQDEKIHWKRIVECSRHKSSNKLMKVTTVSGRNVVCTDSHSFVTRIDNKIVPIKGIELKIGNRIPVINNLPVENKKNIDVKEFLKDSYIFENVDGMLETNYHAKPIPRFIELNWNTGWFIGAYLAEGSANRGSVGISNIDDNYIKNTNDFVDYLGIDSLDIKNQGEYGPSRTLVIHSSLLGRFIIATCGTRADFKKVPNFAYSASNEFVSGLLRGYFDGDGNFHVDRKMIRASSNSKELIDGISLLLSRFRIFSYKVNDKKGQSWLLIPYKYAPLFLQYINSGIEYKRKSLEELAEKAKMFWNSKSQDYTDMISGFGDLFYRTAKKLGYRTRYVNNFTKRQKIGRTALYRYIKIFERLAEEKKIDINDELNIMKRMFYSDVIWDSIEKIEYVDYDKEYVYDLSVPELETFTTFNGIITHNTLNIFHFAGVSEVAVTQGLPRLIELFDARKDISTPAMEIYLKDPYNKDGEKARKIAGMIKEKILDDVVSEFSIDMLKSTIEIKLDKGKMRELGITMKIIIEQLEKALKGVSVKEHDGGIQLKIKIKEHKLNDVYKLKEKARNVYIGGVKYIKQVLPTKKGNEFIIICSGSNLSDVMEVNEVDETRTVTNDIFEIEKVLGVEAARQSIMEEAIAVIEKQGLDIDIRHIMLVADIMTNRGTIKGITRSGITGEKESVLARASFETPIKHLVNASLKGEIDYLNSIIENILLNQSVPVGTGLPGLVAKMKTEKK